MFYGILAFGFFVLHDINCKAHNNERLTALFTAGAALLGLAIADEAIRQRAVLSLPWRIITGVLALIFLALLIYAVFIAVKPAQKNDPDHPWWQQKLVDTGLYALCRHPGVWFLCLFCLCLGPCTGFTAYSAIVYTILDILLCWFEDRMVFPETIPGYEQYKRRTPFLFPNRESVKRCRETWGKPRRVDKH